MHDRIAVLQGAIHRQVERRLARNRFGLSQVVSEIMEGLPS